MCKLFIISTFIFAFLLTQVSNVSISQNNLGIQKTQKVIPEKMSPESNKISQKLAAASSPLAWLHDIPDDNSKTGLIAEVIQLPDKGLASFKVNCNTTVMNSLNSIYKNQKKINSVRLILRTNPKEIKEEMYTMRNVTISALSKIDANTMSLSLSFDKKMLNKNVVTGIQLNPGPPKNAELIKFDRENFGWIFLSDKKNAIPYQIKLQKYFKPDLNRNLKLEIVNDNSSDDALNILQSLKKYSLIVFVLPDTKSLQYVEYKLHQPVLISTNKLKDQIIVEISSDNIVYYGLE